MKTIAARVRRFLWPFNCPSNNPAVQNSYQQEIQIGRNRTMKKNSKVALVAATLVTFASLTAGAMGASLFTVANPYRHFQHQTEAGGVWTEQFDGCCYATSAGTVAMSIAANNPGITMNGFTNTSVGAEDFEKAYRIGGTSGTVANGVGAGPAWVGNGGWVNAPWFGGADAGKLRVADYYLGGANDNWATIATTLPTLNVVGAFGLVEAVAPFPPADVEWWTYHVVGVYDFDFAARTMSFTDSNKDRAGTEYTTGGGHVLGGAILTGAGVLDTASWTVAGIVTNNGGAGMDDEVLKSLRVVYLIPEPSSVLLLGLGSLVVVLRRSRIRAGACSRAA
jgi:PEP-CTERM motif